MERLAAVLRVKHYLTRVFIRIQVNAGAEGYALALRNSYFNAVKGAAARCRPTLPVADILLFPSLCKEFCFDFCNSYYKE